MSEARCDQCGATWHDVRARWCGRCGSRLPAAAAPARRTTPRTWLWLLAIPLAAAAVVGVILAESLERPHTRLGRDSNTVQIPPPPAGTRGVATAGMDVTAPAEPCQPEGCVAWHLPGLQQRPVLAAGGLLVHLGSDRITAVHADTGEVAWQRTSTLSQPRSADPTGGTRNALEPLPSAYAIGDGLLLIANGGRLVAHDLHSGRPRHRLDLSPLWITHIAHAGDGVIAAGHGAYPQASLQVRSVGFDGVERWSVATAASMPLPVPGAGVAHAVLVDGLGGEEELALLDALDGTVRWSRPGGDVEVVSLDPLLLLDHLTDEVQLVDAASGELRVAVQATSAIVDAALAGPWLAVHTEAGLDLHDLATGEGAMRDVTPTRWAAPAMAAGRFDPHPRARTAAASGSRASFMVNVAAIAANGGVVTGAWPAVVVRPPTLPDLCCARIEDLGDGGAHLTVGNDDFVGWADIGTDSAYILGDVLHNPYTWLRRAEGTLAMRDVVEDGDLTIVGLPWQGPITVPSPARIVSADPLVVLGPAGLTRLDQTLLR